MFDFFEVGGAVRDRFLGVNSKDVDFAVVAHQPEDFENVNDAFQSLHDHLEDRGFKVFLSTPEFLTIRAQVPVNHELINRTTVADFVLARKDGPSSDGRRPDFVLPGTLHDDLSRRDFTVNAMAVDSSGILIDPFNGMEDLHNKWLRFVGDAEQRIAEDGLRAIRALRFSLTKGFTMDHTVADALRSDDTINHLRSVSLDRVRDELSKMFNHNTLQTLEVLEDFSVIRDFAFSSGVLKLQPTLAKTVR